MVEEEEAGPRQDEEAVEVGWVRGCCCGGGGGGRGGLLLLLLLLLFLASYWFCGCIVYVGVGK